MYEQFRSPARPEAVPAIDCKEPVIDRKVEARYRTSLIRNATALCGMKADKFCGTDLFKDDPNDAYDKVFWEVTGVGAGNVGLLLLKDKKPSEALDAIIAKKSAWALDCAGWAQTCCALGHKDLIGAEAFDEQFSGTFYISQFDTVPVFPGSDFLRGGPDEDFVRRLNTGQLCTQVYSEQYLLENAPAGSLFIFTNDDQPPKDAYEFEHTLKLDTDSFAALGVAAKCVLSQQELREGLAAKSFTAANAGETLVDYAARIIWLRTVRYLNVSLLK